MVRIARNDRLDYESDYVAPKAQWSYFWDKTQAFRPPLYSTLWTLFTFCPPLHSTLWAYVLHTLPRMSVHFFRASRHTNSAQCLLYGKHPTPLFIPSHLSGNYSAFFCYFNSFFPYLLKLDCHLRTLVLHGGHPSLPPSLLSASNNTLRTRCVTASHGIRGDRSRGGDKSLLKKTVQ